VVATIRALIALLAVALSGATDNSVAAVVPASLQAISTTRSLATFTRPSLSPDGSTALYNVCSPRTLESARASLFPYKDCSVQIVDVRSRRMQTLNKVSQDAWQPVWSPRGNLVAFFSGTDFLASRLYVRSAKGALVDLGPVFGDRAAQWADENTLLVERALPKSGHSVSVAVDPYRTATTTPYSTGTVYRSTNDLTQQELVRFSKTAPLAHTRSGQ
jgi:hypothetical protein